MRTGGKREIRAHSKCFLGTDASMQLDRVGYTITTDVRRGAKGQEPPKLAEEVLSSRDDMIAVEAFFKNVRERKQPAANPETGHLATNVGHLMNIAWQTGRTIRWDAAKEQVIGDPEAQ